MTNICVRTGKPLGKGGTAALVAAGAAVGATAVAAYSANQVVDFALKRQPLGSDSVFFERLAQAMPGTAGLDFAESRSCVERQVKASQTELYANVQVERVTIPAAKPSQKVVAYLYRPAQPSTRWVILVHGYRGSHYEMDGLANEYVKRGFNVLAPDLRAQGESDGDYLGLGCIEAADIQLWADYLLVRFGEENQIVLHGHSMGATVALIAAGNGLPDQVKAVISDCAYTDALSLIRKMAFWEKRPGDVLALSVRAVMKLRSGIDLGKSDALAAVKRSVHPTLFIHGGADAWVPSTMAVDLYTNAAAELRELHVVPRAGHAESFALDPEAYFKLVDGFLAKAGVSTEPSAPEGPVAAPEEPAVQ